MEVRRVKNLAALSGGNSAAGREVVLQQSCNKVGLG